MLAVFAKYPMDHAKEISQRYGDLLAECSRIFARAADECIQGGAARPVDESPRELRERMRLLHEGLAVKTYATVAAADDRWSLFEKTLATRLCAHLTGRWLEGKELRTAAARLFADAKRLEWSDLLRPFRVHPSLRDLVPALQTNVIRMAHLIAKADGDIGDEELTAIRHIEQALDELLLPADPDEPDDHGPYEQARIPTTRRSPNGSTQHGSDAQKSGSSSQPDKTTPPPDLDTLLQQLDDLIGLESVKTEVRTLSNLLQMRRHRASLGLPAAEMSLHMVFRGNPGTGKTTVARLIAQIFAALGILEKGHLVETDRSGLVAEYSGQTGPKTHQVIDQALDGVLFIDEAYSLISSETEDPYGAEAVQVLLKRMEDQRDRLVVILAGYPRPLDQLLAANPGLRSRFTHHLTFEDYDPSALGQIFEAKANQLHYVVNSDCRARLLQGFTWAYDHRDENFGNGRYARNVLERAIRRMANRIASVTPLTKELLTTFQPEDFEFADVPAYWFREPREIKVEVGCTHCGKVGSIEGTRLGSRLRCPKCRQPFVALWGKLESAPAADSDA